MRGLRRLCPWRGRVIHWVAWFGVSLVLGACTALPTDRPLSAQWSGRFSLNVESDPPQSWSAGFELSGSPSAGELMLNSPLGQQVAALRWSPQGAQLLQGGQLTHYPSLDEMTRQLGGAAMPVHAMFDWFDGRQRVTDGWEADLSGHAQGRIQARRTQPLPGAQLRVILLP